MNDKPILCDFCLKPATEAVEDINYCDKHFMEAGDKGEHLSDLAKDDEN